MTLIKPFSGLRVVPTHAEAVLAPPYDVLSSAEARVRAAGKPYSFLHVSKPEIDLAPGLSPYAAEVYAQGAHNLHALTAAGVLARDPAPYYYVYQLTWQGRTQTGLVATASVAAYQAQRIRRHEHTRPEKEDDRVRHIEAMNAQTGPVFLAYPEAAAADALIRAACGGEPEVDVTADSGVRHALWVVRDASLIAGLSAAFEALPALYIADGHHRSAAAARVAATRRQAGNNATASEYFLAVLFPHHELAILDYNRVVKDLNGFSPEDFLLALEHHFVLEESAGMARPAEPGEWGMYLSHRWHRMRLRPQFRCDDDPVARLDVARLDRYALAPLLGITDPRRDPRIDFVGGIRGLGELQRRVDSGEMAVAFALYPTRIEDLMAVADRGEVMPPKSTWFEPKLADGLVSHVLD